MAALGALPEDALVLPAHGLPFRTLRRRVTAVRDEHLTRGGSITEFCREPRSTQEAASRLFRFGRLDRSTRCWRCARRLAHLRHLECAGRLGAKAAAPRCAGWPADAAAAGP